MTDQPTHVGPAQQATAGIAQATPQVASQPAPPVATPQPPAPVQPQPVGAAPTGQQPPQLFEYQQPTEDQIQRIQALRQSFKDLHTQMTNLIPPSQELSEAVCYLRTAAMWCNAGVVFNGARPEVHP